MVLDRNPVPVPAYSQDPVDILPVPQLLSADVHCPRFPLLSQPPLCLHQGCLPAETTSVITLDPKVEQEIMSSVKQTEQGAYLTMDPEKTKAIMDSVRTETEKLESLGKNPIIITSPIVRMYFKKLTEDYFKDLIVVSYNEVESDVELQSVGMVTA